MTVKELIEKLQSLPDQNAEVVLVDGILDLAVKLTHVISKSEWETGAIDLVGTKLPKMETSWDDEDEDEDE